MPETNEPSQAEVVPVDAATLIALRDEPEAGSFSAFFVQRSQKSRFMGGLVVFPGGKVDEADRDPAWRALCTDPRLPPGGRDNDGGADEDGWRALGIAACREALEEAALLPATRAAGAFDHAALLALRGRIEAGAAFRALAAEAGLRLDLDTLHPWSRWITPRNQSKRFDTRFFVARAAPGQEGAHDGHETIASFWATPKDVLARFEAGSIELAPPTHRTLELLAEMTKVEQVLAAAEHASLAILCPEVVRHTDVSGETVALTLPGDPEHSVREVRIPGRSRYVLRSGAWRPESPPPR
ncbi:hypothetical protein [Pendulispora albinea]|uniref:Nudix hydrolase domain-containing protein n=1 Tax=Pendulispora albinea TaxID=2741071 RepID=A0ABZ2M5L1_9BACT